MEIIVALDGGIGNQLFQYAFAQALKEMYKAQVFFDSAFIYRRQNKDAPRKNKLSLLLKHPLVEISDYQTEARWWQRLLGAKYYQLIKEMPIHCFKQEYQQQAGKYLCFQGYWQSEKYFYRVKQQVIDSISFEIIAHKPVVAKYSEAIRNSKNAVAIHVRRGDYYKYGNELIYRDLGNSNYYQIAIQTILDKIPNASFYIFSDDQDWCKNKFQGIANTYFVDDTAQDIEDLYLLSSCQHQIIANSSFSWWGAYLNQNLQKIVVAPKEWFLNEWSSQDIVPDNWVKIPS